MKSWQFCDTVSGAEASAVVYSIAGTAKANNLRPCYYLDYILKEMANRQDDTGTSYLEGLLPWSDKLPEECHKVVKVQNQK